MPIGLKNINNIINILAKVIYYGLIFYIAVMLSDVFWWIFTPSSPQIEYNTSSATEFDNAEKFVVNRNPFGIPVEVKEKVVAKPSIASLIKITGIYVNDKKHSFVFYELNGKNNLGRIGDKLDTAVIKSIKSNSIEITDNGNDFNIEFIKTNSQGSSYSATNNNTMPTVNDQNSNSQNQLDSQRLINNQSALDNNSDKLNNDELNKKREQLIQDFMNHKESVK
jgi:type II secretory pathway component PulC